MIREKIALDIDDVLLGTTDAVRCYVNKRTGHELQPEHYRAPGSYWGYYEQVWNKAGIEDVGYNTLFHEELAQGLVKVMPVEGAVQGIAELAKYYDLAAVTSRPAELRAITRACLDNLFPGFLPQVVHLGHSASAKQTKGEACEELGAKWLADDNIDHCKTTQGRPTEAVLFGEYGWHQDVPEWLDHRISWAGLLEFFGAQG
jgi:hypothetical protein